MTTLKDNIIQIVGENPDFLDDVLVQFKKVTYSNDDFIMKEGEICKSVFFVETGMLHVTTSDKLQNEITIDIVIDNQWFTDINSFKTESSSMLNIRVKKGSTIHILSKDSFDQFIVKVPKFAEAYMKIIEQKFSESMMRITSFTTMNSKEKIEWLRKYKPEFFLKLTDKLIASYLGISHETFSRQK